METLNCSSSLKSLCPWSCVWPGQYRRLDLCHHDRQTFVHRLVHIPCLFFSFGGLLVIWVFVHRIFVVPTWGFGFSCGIWRFRYLLIWDCVVTPLIYLTSPSDWYRQFPRVITVLRVMTPITADNLWSSRMKFRYSRTEIAVCTSLRVMESLSHDLWFLCLNLEIDLTLNTISSSLLTSLPSTTLSRSVHTLKYTVCFPHTILSHRCEWWS